MLTSKSFLKPFLSLALTATILAPAGAFAATRPVPATHLFLGGKARTIHFSIRNQTGAALDLRMGDQVVNLASGKTIDLHLPSGTRIVTAAKSDKREAGSLICEVSPAAADTTIVLN